MNKEQKETQQAFLDSEKEVLNNLKKNYQDALDEINNKIEILMARQDADMQHVIYQIEYQKALKTQVQSILEQLQTNNFETVSEYLTNCYEDGFIGTMYDLQKQGVPLVMPMDQEQIVAAIQHETKLSEDLYTSLGKDIKDLQKKISSEISRGISTGQMFSEISRNIASYAGISRNNAMRIARTEGHRIQIQATMNAQHKAKEKGADIVKQWDASLDGKTRPHHRQLDGQIRELDEDFEVGGMKVEAPGMFGKASEDINCRCALLQRARWALDSEYTKWSPDAPVLIDDDGTTQLIKIDAKNMKEFKGIYQDITGQMTMNMGYRNERVRSGSQKINSQDTLENIGKSSKIKASTKATADGKILTDPVEKARVINEAIATKEPFYAEDLRKAYKFYGVQPKDGCYDVLIHGASTFVEYEHKYNLDAETLYMIISGRRDYHADNIRLLSCSTGKVTENGYCVAQELADRLGVDVYAPIDTLNINPNGKLTVGLKDLSEKEGFKWFYPGGER